MLLWQDTTTNHAVNVRYLTAGILWGEGIESCLCHLSWMVHNNIGWCTEDVISHWMVVSKAVRAVLACSTLGQSSLPVILFSRPEPWISLCAWHTQCCQHHSIPASEQAIHHHNQPDSYRPMMISPLKLIQVCITEMLSEATEVSTTWEARMFTTNNWRPLCRPQGAWFKCTLGTNLMFIHLLHAWPRDMCKPTFIVLQMFSQGGSIFFVFFC